MPRHTERTFGRRTSWTRSARLRARREQGPPAGRVAGRRLEGLAGPPGPGDERGRRLGRDRPGHLPADQTARSPPGRRPRPDRARVARPGQGRTPAPVGQDAHREREDLRGGAPLRQVGHRLALGGPAQLGDARQRGELRLAVGERGDGQRQGPRARAGGAANRGRRARTPGSGSRTSSRSGLAGRLQAQRARGRRGRPAHARVPIREQLPAPARSRRRPPRAAATSTAAARTSGSGESSARGAAARPRAGTACRGGGSPRRAPGRLRAHRPARAASRLRASSPPGQSARAARRLAGVCERSATIFARTSGRSPAAWSRSDSRIAATSSGPGRSSSQRPQRREARRDLLALHPPQHGQPHGVVGDRPAPDRAPGDRLGPLPGHGVRRPRGRPIAPVDPRPRLLVDAGEQHRRTRAAAGSGSRPSRSIRPSTTSGSDRSASARSARVRVGRRPARRGAQDRGPVRRAAQRLHGRVRQGGVGLVERPLQPGRRIPASAAGPGRRDLRARRAGRVRRRGRPVARPDRRRPVARQAMPGARPGRPGRPRRGPPGPGRAARRSDLASSTSSSIAVGPAGWARTQTACSRPRTPTRPAPDRVAHRVQRLASAAFEATWASNRSA